MAFKIESDNRGAAPDVLPLRAELFNADQMDLHGVDLAVAHRTNPATGQNRLLDRLAKNERIIGDTCKLLISAVQDKHQITSAEEWLLDNFYLIDDQISTAKRHLPKSYSRGLPRLLKGPSADLPRIYDIALEAVAHSDAHLNSETLARFITAYQTVTPLQLGELWAFPIMLRLALIENLRRIAARLALSRVQQNLADFWADRMTDSAEKDSTSLILVIADMARSSPPMDGAFVAEITRRLQGHGTALALPLSWIEQRLSQTGTNIEQLVTIVVQQQAADQVSVSNSIGSLRFLETTNWREFVENLSLVEKTLQQDPAGFYTRMDFATRDLYRHSVESIAIKSNMPENAVVEQALTLAKDNADVAGIQSPASHIGYYLAGDGKTILEKKTHAVFPVMERIYNFGHQWPLSLYLGSISALTAAAAFPMIRAASNEADKGPELLFFIYVLSIIASSQLAITMVNWLVTTLAKPHFLPRLDFSQAIPAEARTLVVVPTLLTSKENVDDLCEALEIRYLANSVDHLHFCLLTDFADAPAQSMPGDDTLIRQATAAINALNAKYAKEETVFFLLHRPRVWNAQENMWMGHERKRGKIGALNRFLRGGEETDFSCIVGLTEILRQVRYVITLDTDTQLPRDSAWQFIGAMAHPLNRPHYDPEKRRVTSGYGIIQPRVTASLPGTNASLYARLSGGEPGIDPYTRAVSDVYQDAFQEGSFVGKGIYEVDAFEKALAGQFPDNRILSHDLLEGNYARSGLLTDVQLYEPYPSQYAQDVSRRHRWIRGDWQIAAWLLPTVPGPDGKRLKNPLSVLSRWKIFDNLRRSVIPLVLTCFLIMGWFLFSSPWMSTLAVIGIYLIPSLMGSLLDLARKTTEVSTAQHLSTFYSSTLRHFSNVGFTLTMLPYEAYYHTDAIARAVWRMAISRKKLLEWTPSSGNARDNNADLFSVTRLMWFAPGLSVVTITLLVLFKPSALDSAFIIVSAWLFSPFVAFWLSQPVAPSIAPLKDDQIVYLRKIARKTWAFFEAYVGPDDNWLPPDNVQELPVAAIAHRTSPTNMGLSLLANLTAWDFGYIPMKTLLMRTSHTLDTMEDLDRHEGHFYNWYDTKTLAPLMPEYISAVDSGNLAGHLLTLRQGLFALADQPVVNLNLFEGLRDTLNILADMGDGELPADLLAIENILSAPLPETLGAFYDVLLHVATTVENFSEHFRDDNISDAAAWIQVLSTQCRQTVIDMAEILEVSEGMKTLLSSSNLHMLAEHDHAAISHFARKRMEILEGLAQRCGNMSEMNFAFLYDRDNHLLSIGYNVTDRRWDSGYYDLLASEARLAIFVAVAQGEIPQESWFALGRKMTRAGGKPALLSWSGSMFEYLMPLLVMPPCEGTLLDQTCKAAVHRQIEYGEQRGVPWGMSESGYHVFDTHLNYQYRAFGVPGLGLKRGLADDLVIAPYASVMALMVSPQEACNNLQRLSHEGFEGKFGFYEAIDYTASRVPRGKNFALVQSFMIHHQGMGFLSLSYLLLNKPMQKRFEAEPRFQATMLLLHEKIPKISSFQSDETDLSIIRTATTLPEPATRYFTTAITPVPEVQLLSNGRYHAMVTNAGGSSSRWKDLAVTRWRTDTTRDNWGTFCYIRDTVSGAFWSNSYQPTLSVPKLYESILSEGRVEFRRTDDDIETRTEIVVSPEDDVELRRIHLTNHGRSQKTLDVTSYAEIVLAPAAADMAHPAFSNLFVQTEILPERKAILCTRRARSAQESPPWMSHQMSVHGADVQMVSYETDRMKFIGRGNDVSAPQAIKDAVLSDSQGSVLDPIVSVRCQVSLAPGDTVIIDIITGAAEDRDTCLLLIDKYQDINLANRMIELAWSHSHVILRQLNATESDAQLYSRLIGSVLYPNAALRADAATIIKNRRGQSGLWSYAISGDLPIVLLQIKESENINLVRQMVQAHAYWRLKGVAVDLVIWNEDQGGYRQVLQDQIMGLISAGVESNVIDRPGGIFVRPGDQIATEDRILLESVACAIIRDSDGPLIEQINRIGAKVPRVPRLVPTQISRPANGNVKTQKPDLMLSNGLGGFTQDGREYVIETGPGKRTPAPWSNVLANPDFGTVLSESGQSYSWHENAHEFRLTPWNNDPVTDSGGEVFYVRDEESGKFWSPTPLPAPDTAAYTTRHGFGYSVFEHIHDGIHTELWVYVAIDAPVKFYVLKIRNESGRARKLSATGYVEWVMGDMRSKTGMHVVTEIDKNTGAIFARNAYNTEFGDRVAFFDINDITRSFTCDRREFIGRNGSLAHPTSMDRLRLSGKVGAGLDPCAALQSFFDVADGASHEIVFKLGIGGRNSAQASAFTQKFHGRSGARAALEAVQAHWTKNLGAVQIETPDQSLNILANGWLMYQTIACRLWARSGYYQSGGAFGFRDQLQDAMAVVHTRPELLRAQLLLCAAHQFVEGDVQHWWHPPLDRGVRTKCSDDYLWLPLAACRYAAVTGDASVMQETTHFLEGRLLGPDEDSYYDLPGRSVETATLYEHCVRAIRRGLNFGVHGLPLIGSCDWNDGMDKVGEHGKGESVWLGFFLYDILGRFQSLAKLNDDSGFAEFCADAAISLRANIEKNAWDGGWYRRAYFDDGTPLGSAQNEDCQIDSLSQSWAVLSGAGDPERARMGMEAVDARLVRRDDGLIQLLDPPFDKSDMNPGYIRGYVPGVRENGGQYTHAAIWTAMAFAKMGDGDRCYDLTRMINPINHALTAATAAHYRVEPYVVAADVYGVAPHTGRGGWTWYTGSSGWMYRLILESLLGLTLEDGRLSFNPTVPSSWDKFSIDYRYRTSLYRINITMVQSEANTVIVQVNGETQEGPSILLMDDGQTHDVEIRIGKKNAAALTDIG